MIKYFRTKGRINRTELFALTVVILILESITYLIWGKDSDIFLTISILLFVIYLIQCSKRYHDINKWGINGFVWWIIPVLNLVYFFQLYFSKGTDTENKYGEPSDFKIIHKKQPDAVNKSEISKEKKPKTLKENTKVARQGGTVAGNARKEIEQKTGKRVVSSDNAKELEEGLPKKQIENNIFLSDSIYKKER